LLPLGLAWLLVLWLALMVAGAVAVAVTFFF
jgi:hypothetical protein